MKNPGIIILCIAAILLRLINLNSVQFFDESAWTASLFPSAKYIFNLPPLALFLFKLITGISVPILGLKTISFRIFPLIFNLLTIVIVYLLAERIYGKKTAFFSLFLMGFSFYSILNAVQISDDSLLIFLFTLFFLFYIIYEQTGKKKYLIYSGITLAAAIASRFTGILIFINFFFLQPVQ